MALSRPEFFFSISFTLIKSKWLPPPSIRCKCFVVFILASSTPLPHPQCPATPPCDMFWDTPYSFSQQGFHVLLSVSGVLFPWLPGGTFYTSELSLNSISWENAPLPDYLKHCFSLQCGIWIHQGKDKIDNPLGYRKKILACPFVFIFMSLKICTMYLYIIYKIK